MSQPAPVISSRWTTVRRMIRARIPGLLLLLVGAGLQFSIMAADQRFTFSVLVGLFACAVAAFGVLHLFGAFEPDDEPATHTVELAALRRPLLELALAVAVLLAVLKSAVAGVIPFQIWTCAILVPATFLLTVVAAFRLARRLGAFGADEAGIDRPLLRRHGFWLLALAALIYLPLLGSFSLIDPWETHYGEVAREMLARDDWISLWWAQDGWFFSKPILNFWLQGLSFSLLGVNYAPDQMLAGVEAGRWPQPEWAARWPIFLLTAFGSYVLYKSTARFFGRRAAFLGGLVLLTAPYWLLIARQTMTDMPYVATLTAAMGFILLGLFTADEQSTRSVDLKLARARLRFSLTHVLLLLVLVCALPQVLYLASRNVTLHLDRRDSAAEQATHPSLSLIDLARGDARPVGFSVHADEVAEGSGLGNCGLPGNAACRAQRQLHNERIQPALMALLYSVLLGIFVWTNRRERQLSKLLFLAGWLATAVAVMAKGAPGLVLPLFVLGAYVALRNDWKQLTRADLGGLLLLLVAVCLPWFIQMYLRHGSAFIDRLLWHDMYKRAFEHVHDTNQGDDISIRYYVWQLGYGLFPWNGICAAGLVWWFRRERDGFDRLHQAALVLFIWAIGAFGMFTVSLTKFHHYILPMVPPLAALAGILLSDALGPTEESEQSTPRQLGYLATLTSGVALMVLGVALCLPGSLIGTGGEAVAGRPWWGAGVLVVGMAATAVAIVLLGPRAPARSAKGSFLSPAVGAVGLVAAAAVALAGRDMATKADDGSIRLMHLFTYQYKRPWPEALDFRFTQLAFTVVAVIVFLAWLVRRLRPHAVIAASALGVLCAAWVANVYLFRAAPHWGQRETVVAYYQNRKAPEELLVAFQMNWKGENFYTGNRVPAFVSSGKKFKSWVEGQKMDGTKVMFFTTEHTRLKSLQRELDNPAVFEILTDKTVNNKFFVARAQFD